MLKIMFTLIISLLNNVGETIQENQRTLIYGTQINRDLSLSIYSSKNTYFIELSKIIYNNTGVDHDKLTEMVIPKVEGSDFGNSSITNSGCGYNKKIDPLILGMYDTNYLDKSGEYLTKVIKAWRIDIKNFKFIEISTKNMFCKFQWVPGTY
jgi:hypothetical protein